MKRKESSLSKTERKPMGELVLTASAAVTAGVGILVLLGWILDIDGLRAFLPGVTNPMVATTALCFVGLAAALLLLRPPQPSRSRVFIARSLSLGAAVVGILVLGGYAFGWETGLDRFLYRPSAMPFTGAMAVPTAISFIFTGSALVALTTRRRRAATLAQALALVGAVAPLLSLVGRAYGLPTLSNYFAGTVVMALHTALAFVVLVVGILTARPREGVVRTFTAREPGGWLLRTLLLPAWVVVFLVGWLRLIGEQAGHYPREFGVALIVTATILLLTGLMLFGARSLNRSEGERRRAQEMLRESEVTRRAVLASIGDGVVTTDEKGLVLSANSAMERISGWRADEVVGRRYADAYPLADASGRAIPEDQRLLARAIASREVVASRGFETSLVTRDGRRVPVAITAAPVFDEDGRLIGGVDVIRDVSHEREVDTMKSALISTVSHELRTPLTMIEGFAELLLTRDLQPEQARHAAAQIHESSQRLERLIDDLLSVSRIESGRLEARPEPVDLGGLVQEVAGHFAAHRLHLDLDGVGEVLADRDMVVRILTNLLSNAMKYSPGDDPISVVAREDRESASVSVTDSGIGMTPEEQAQLFQKFFRADHPEVRNARGTGLGLYITRSLVELQGGRIRVESKPGQGSSFTFTLPLADEGEEAE